MVKPKGKNTPGDKYCRKCKAICCHNLAMAIGKPVNRKEIEDLKWQLHFDTVKVYIHEHHWYQWVKGKCMYLSKDNRCTIYDKRPITCRRHNPPNCEYFGDFYDVMLNTPEELEEYLISKKPKKKRTKSFRKSKKS
ncbi:YkgJ family cysteine cluster protein [Elusimicrobiota bacterium]